MERPDTTAAGRPGFVLLHILLPMAALVASSEVTSLVQSTRAEEPKAASTDANPGKNLYQRHCAGCHGERGDGVGQAARFLFPKPRDFRAGRFRLVSTENSQPTLDDIKTVLVRGMPGSAMPPWPKLTDRDRALLAEYVIDLRRDGIREREKASAAENGEEFDAAGVETLIKQMTTPGAPIPAPAIPHSTAESIARGREQFMKACASCHGATGKGDGQQKMIDVEGWPDRPRDLTLGIFKGSPDPQSVYRRVFAGMPGTPMPASKWTPEQVIDVVHFVLSLSDPAVRESTVLNRERIAALSVDRRLDSLDATTWDRAAPARIHTTPLWWRDESPVDIEVRAIRNGRELALRLSWPDSSADRHHGRSESFADAAGIALSHGSSEPFLGMGSRAEPVDFWFWDADRQSGLQDVDEVNPRIMVDVYPFGERAVDTAEYRRPGTTADAQAQPGLAARAVGNLRSAGKNSPIGTALEAGGPGTLTFRPSINQTVKAQGNWRDGRWTVTFVGPITPAAGPALKQGDAFSVTFAVWDGAHHDRDGQKRITIWQDLVLESSKR